MNEEKIKRYIPKIKSFVNNLFIFGRISKKDYGEISSYIDPLMEIDVAALESELTRLREEREKMRELLSDWYLLDNDNRECVEPCDCIFHKTEYLLSSIKGETTQNN